MRILILIDWFAPAFKGGGPIQSVMNMVENAEEGFEYRIICSNKDLDGIVLQVEADKWVPYNEQTQVWYSSNNKQVLNLVNQTTISWGADALFINGIYSAYYNFFPILLAKSPRKIISVRGTLHDGALAQKKFKKKVFLRAWKTLKLHHKYEFHASTEEEKNFVFKTFGNKVKVSVAANFPKVFKASSYPRKEKNTLTLSSIALISPMKNHLLVLKALQNCKSNIQYNIYGPVKDSAYWEKCKEQIEKMPSNVAVHYKGELSPFMVEQTLAECHVFILPSKSENFGHAIYEALIAGKPVITSHTTPWNNLSKAKAGINVSPDTVPELTTAIEIFAQQGEEEFLQWNQGAIDYAKRKIDIQEIKTQYKNMFVVQPQQIKSLNHH